MGKQTHVKSSTGKADNAEIPSKKVSSKKRKNAENSAKEKNVVEDQPIALNHPSESPPAETWSKSKKKRMRMLKSKQHKTESAAPSSGDVDDKDTAPLSILNSTEEGVLNKASKLQNAFKARLSGSRFRILNEELYTTTSEESFQRFSNNPELFEQYHEGFRHQVESWPVNPVDVIVRWLSSKYQQSECVVADFGCGDAQLAKDLLKIQYKGKSPFHVHSFDLVSQNELVTACDMANVPLKNKSVDVCVFCLSLMGTNLADFIREAHRVLKDGGKVKIAEVRSRIEYSHSKSSSTKGHEKDTTKNAGTLLEFLDILKQLGFKCTKKDLSNKMFLVLDLEKTGKSPDKHLAFSAKPCIYKRR